MIGAKLMSSMI